MKKRIISLIAIIALVPTMGLRCTLFPSQEATQATQQITLNYWRVFDDQDTMDDIITAYQRLHPNVTINYRKLRIEEYEQALVDALAEDRGPDMFSIHSSWVKKYQSKLTPMPQVLKVGYITTQGTIKKVTVPEVRTVDGYTPKYIRDNFVETVANDVIRDEAGQPRIWGLPLALDTLALFYNRELFNNAGIAQPPKKWDEFESDVKKLTVINPTTGDILQSGAAFGTGKNIQRSSDILSTIMQQDGAEMTNGDQVSFSQTPSKVAERGYSPAADALRFYTDFASSSKDVYTWNVDQPDSFAAFAQGRVAMFFGYSYHATQLKTTSPQLKYDIAPFPQLADNPPVTAANYWIESVSKKTQNTDQAWDFIMFATKAENVKTYLQKAAHPTALRSLIETQKQQDDIAPFASQLLVAKNWYHGSDPQGSERAFSTMIDEALAAKGSSAEEERSKLQPIVSRAAQSVGAGY